MSQVISFKKIFFSFFLFLFTICSYGQRAGYGQPKIDSIKFYYEKFNKFTEYGEYLNNKLLSTNNPRYVRLIIQNRDSVDKYHDLLDKFKK